MKQFILFIFVFLVLATSCTEQEYKDSSNPTAVKSVSLNKTNLTLTEGESFSLSATVLPEDAYDKSIIWSTTDELIAAVSDDGTVLAKKEGNAVITATSHDGGKSATCLVKVEAQLDPSITIGATHISCISAVLSGKANLGKTTASDLKMGIMYSKSSGVLPSTSTIVEANDIEAEYYYSVQITELDPNTTYYYRSFVYENRNYTLGKTKSFVTKDVKTLVSVLAAEKVSSISAKALAKVELTDVIYEKVDANGFVYGTRQDVLEKSITSSMVNDAEGNKLEVYIKDLNPETTYWYSPYITLDGKTMHGDTTSFTTKGIKDLVATREATEVGPTEVTLNGMLDLTDCEYSYLSYGFSYGEGEINSPSSFLPASNLNDNKYSLKLSGLHSGRQYSFAACVRFNSNGSIKYLGDVKTFTTDVVKIESISLDKNEYTFNTIGNTLRLKATILPASATDKSIKWTSSNEQVATVDANGIITAIGNGSATITVTTNDQGKAATCNITVVQWVTGIQLDKTVLTLNEGQEYLLSATVIPDNAANKTLIWTSSDESVATVDSNGKVKAVSKGTATINATAIDGSGKNAGCSVSINRLVSSIQLDKASLTLYRGNSNVTEKITATVSPFDANNTDIEWTSSNTAVATVSISGVVTGKAPGTANITATANDGSGASAICEVEVKQYVTRITLSKTSLSLISGAHETIVVTSVLPDNANDKTLIWTSSDESVATVDSNGKVKAVSKGAATIKAEAMDGSGIFAICSVTVNRLVSSIELDKTSLALYRRSSDVTEIITAMVAPSDASNTGVEWTSSNTTVATVSTSGVVTGKSRGTSTITATAKDGSEVSATCEVEVKQYVTSIALSKTSLSLVIGSNETISVISVLPDNANNKTYTWSSSDYAIALVDDTGKVTAKTKGTATIKATANDGSGVFASCSVNVKNPCPVGAIDLGLSVYWAPSNLSETGLCANPEDYGDYYAWGETESRGGSYSWSTYKFGTSYSDSFSKYNTNSLYGTVDNKTVLEAEDDVAHVKLGGNWRLPTDEEWTELRTQCTWTWTARYGVNGYKVTGPNGKIIFLPAAGRRVGASLGNVGSSGFYWSSSLRADSPNYAWDVYFVSSDVNRSYTTRYCGLSVRPVSE